jgi:hypothetical protein
VSGSSRAVHVKVPESGGWWALRMAWPLRLVTTVVAQARSGKMWTVHASAENEGYWRLAVWLECMIPPLSTRTEC